MARWLSAQDANASFDLDACIRYALENNVEVKNAKLDEQIAIAQVKETTGIGFPQVNGEVALQHSPTLQRFFSTYRPPAPGEEDSGFGLKPTDAAALGVNPGDVYALENFFQLQNVGDANVSVNQMIFNGSYFVGLRAANAFKDLSRRQANQTKEMVVLNVSKAYYNYLIAKSQRGQARSNIARIDSLYRNTQALYENGFAEKLDADRLKVNLNNLLVTDQQLKNMVTLSEKLLKFQMNYPIEQPIQLDGSLEDIKLDDLMLSDLAEWSYEQRSDYQAMQANRELQELNIRNKYAEALPSLGAFAKLGLITQSPTFGGLFKTESGFEEQFGVGPDKWYGYSSVGFSLQWNIFTGLQRTYQIQQEKLELKKINNGFESMEKSIDLDIAQAQDKLKTSLKSLSVQRDNKDLAKEIFQTTKIKYEEGVGSNLEITEADNALKEAETNYSSALYDAIVAHLELKKALGTLYTE